MSSAQTSLTTPATNVNARRFLTAAWRHVAIANYEVDPAVLVPYVPRGTQLDFYQGRTYVSLVGFLFLNTRILGVPIPYHCNFEELNLRFYVVRKEEHETRRGVVFIKELVRRWAVAKVARWAYNENYEAVPMSHERVGIPTDDILNTPCKEGAHCTYRWKRAQRWNDLTLHVRGTAQTLPAGSESEFIAEHYWGYARQRDGGTIEYRVAHPPWHVWLDCHAELRCDVPQFYPAPFADILTQPPRSAFLLDGSPVTVAFPRRLP